MDFIGNVCEDIVVLGNGRIIARGDIEEIQQNERVRDAYFGG
jgi:ABC-type branched-subunit amino acid transport system ATPase component